MYKANVLNMAADRSLATAISDVIYTLSGEQEDDYRYCNAKQSQNYRTLISSRINPKFLNRPRRTIEDLVRNEEYASNFELESVVLMDPPDLLRYSVSKSLVNPHLKQWVDIKEGTCDCTTFKNRSKIPCIHMFAVIKHTDLSLQDLPSNLVDGDMMTLDIENGDGDHGVDGCAVDGHCPQIPDSLLEDDVVSRAVVHSDFQRKPPSEYKENSKFRNSMETAMKSIMDELYSLDNAAISKLRANGDGQVMLDAVELVRKLCLNQHVKSHGLYKKLKHHPKPMDIEHQRRKAQHLDVKRLAKKGVTEKKEISRAKKATQRLTKRAKRTNIGLSKEAERVQRDNTLKKRDILRDIIEEKERDKGYKTRAKVNKTGRKRKSKRLQNRNEKAGDGMVGPPTKRAKH